MSDKDIESGARWGDVISNNLQASDFGVIVVTREAQNRPWLVFEAGALAKSFQTSRVVPLLVDLGPSDLIGPLTQFQARKPAKEEMLTVVMEINNARPEGSRIEPDRVKVTFDKFWGDFELSLKNCIENAAAEALVSPPPRRPIEDVVDELLNETRNTSRNLEEVAAGVRAMLASGAFIVRSVTPTPPPLGLLGATGAWGPTAATGHSAGTATAVGVGAGLLGGVVFQPMAVGGGPPGSPMGHTAPAGGISVGDTGAVGTPDVKAK